MKITKQMLIDVDTCKKQVELFEKTFPNGATWPDDMEEASRAGLDIHWAISEFKLSGRCRVWHNNGQLAVDEMYKNGDRHGRRRGWHDNGQLGVDESHENGKRHGRRSLWHDNGQLGVDEMWEYGKLIKRVKHEEVYL